MTKREGDEYHLNLFLDSTSNDTSRNSGENIFRQLRSVVSQKVVDIDYEQQIDRWNKYQELLDKVDKKCSRRAGVRLSRNVKHNVKTFTDTVIASLAIIALTALVSLSGSFTIHSIYGVIVSVIALGFI